MPSFVQLALPLLMRIPPARGEPPALFDKIIIENIVTYYGIECKAEENDNAVRRLRFYLISVTL
jgi:hypothetical protein